jgi:hypothetical protein
MNRQQWESVRERFLSGGTVTVEELFEAAELSDRKRHLVLERLTGRSYEDIAADEAMHRGNGQRYTRQRL